MVSSLSIIFIIISAVVSILLPVAVFIYSRRRYKASLKAVGVGIITFIVFSQVLEKLMHMYVINNNLFPNPLAFAVYGALAAGVFEEAGRYISMKFLLKKNREWKDGLAFGIGHGGIEAILIALSLNVQYIIFAQYINNNTFNTNVLEKVGSNELIRKSILAIQDTLVNSPPALFLFGGVERIFALMLHIGASILVIYAVRNRKIIYLFIAIFAHAVIDFFPALYQAGYLSLIQTELVLVVISLLLIMVVVKSKDMFYKSDKEQFKNK